jgi:endonuclease/exonuclease/phosphatase family metal-dependent hydrolase
LKLRAALPFLALLPLACAPAPAAPPAPAPASARVTLRVLTYNIHHGEGRDGRVDLVRIAEVLHGARPDVIALQEVDRGTRRGGGVDQLAELARMLDMHAEFGKAMDYQGGEYGVAVLSRWPIEGAENHALPWSRDLEPRTALTVRFRVGDDGPRVRLTNTHLDNSRDPEEKLEQVRRLNELLASDRTGTGILAGDFNARSGTEVIQLLEQHWTIAWPDGGPPAATTPDGGSGGALQPQPAPIQSQPGPGQPQQGGQQRRGPRGDLVLLQPLGRWCVVESRSIDDNAASDHRPVLTVLDWIEVVAP